MVFERATTRQPRDLAQLNRIAVEWITALTALGAAGLFVVALATGDPLFFWEAVTAASVTVAGIIQRALRRESAVVLLRIAALAIFVNVTFNATPSTLATASATMVVIGIGSALFTQRPRLEMAGFAVFLMIGFPIWHRDDPIDGLAQGLVITLVFIFGATIIHWIRSQLEITGARHEHLFRHAPVSIWLEDFTAVRTHLEALRARGVEDLAAFLAANPDEISKAGQLIEIVEVNDAAPRLLEADSHEQLIGRLDASTFTEESLDSLIPQLQAVWDDRDHVIVEVREGRTLKGNRIEGLLSWTAPRIGGELDLSQTVVAIVDVTEIRRGREQLEALLASKDELIAAVSHELRTPLTAVVGLSGELRDSLESFEPEELNELVSLIAEQSEDVSTIVEDLLAAARAEAGSLQVDPEPVDVGHEVAITLKGLGLTSEVPLERDPHEGTVFADPGRLRQIVRNLVVNAQRYGSAPIRVVVRSRPESVDIEVRDGGPPLPPGQREAIFERYHRAQQRPGVAASVGVGLTVSRELARVMGGDVTYVHDGETVFTLSLPTRASHVPLAAG